MAPSVSAGTLLKPEGGERGSPPTEDAMIQFDKFTQKAQEAMQQAQSLAGKSQSQAIHPIHLLLALANEKDGVVRPVLEKCGVQPAAIVHEAEKALDDIPK